MADGLIGSERGLVRVLVDAQATDPSIRPEHAGMGFLVTDRLVLTCAHVVNSALRRDQLAIEAPPLDCILSLSFPILNDKETRSARVADWSPPGADGLDCAILELVEPESAEASVTILSVLPKTEIEDARVSVFGSLAPTHPGAHLSGRLLGEVGAGWGQIDVEGRFGVQPGYSGSGVWSRDQRSMIGMMVTRQIGKEGLTAYFLPAHRIAERFGALVPLEVRRLPLRRQASFTVVAIILFLLVLAHFIAHTSGSSTWITPWAEGDRELAAFFGAHMFAVILGPFVMYHALVHARSFSMRPWWQRVPSVFGIRSAAMLDNTRLGATMVIIFLLFLPAVGQGVLLDQAFGDDRKIVAYAKERCECVTGQMWCYPKDQNWCQQEGVGVWSFRTDLPYWDYAYRFVGNCAEADCAMTTFFPMLQPAILYGATALAYGLFLLFLFSLLRPWPYLIQRQLRVDSGKPG